MPDRNPILAPLLSPTPTTPAAPVVVLRKPPICDPTEIALKVLNREDKVKKILRKEKLMNLPANSPHIFHKTQLISPPIYKLDPLRFCQPNSFARRSMLAQISRGDLFHLHLIGIVFTQFLPSLLIGYYIITTDAFFSSDMYLSTNELIDLLNIFTGPVDQHIGGSSAGVIDGKTAAQVLHSAASESSF